MKRRLLSLFLVLTFVFGLAACVAEPETRRHNRDRDRDRDRDRYTEEYNEAPAELSNEDVEYYEYEDDDDDDYDQDIPPSYNGELIDITINSQLSSYWGYQTGWAAQVFEEKFGVRVNIIPDIDGDFGDIVIFGSDGNVYQQAAQGGLLLDWEQNDLLRNHGSYIWNNMPFALEKNRDISGTGGVYGFGFNVGTIDGHQTHIYYPYLRWDLYQQLGMPPINTLEDFIPVLAAMKELEPVNAFGQTTWGVSSFPDWDYEMVMMVKATAALYGWEEFGIGLYNAATQEFQGALEPDGQYLRMLKFYNTLHQMGLFDPDSMTQTFHDAATKYSNGTSFWNIFTFVAEGYNSYENMEAGRMMACVPAADQRNLLEGLNVEGGNRVWAIGAHTEHPELVMQIINWLCTPEGVLTYNYGPQGVTWDYDQFGNTYLTSEGLSVHHDGWSLITFNGVEQSYRDGQFWHNNSTRDINSVNPESRSNESFNWRTWSSTISLNEPTQAEQSWRDWAGADTPDQFLKNQGMEVISHGWNTGFIMRGREAELEMLWQNVSNTIISGSWRAIYASSDSEFEQIVTDMIAEANTYGYQECIAWLIERAGERRQHDSFFRALS